MPSGTRFRGLPLARRLAIVRDGTAWFDRHLADLTDADLDDASALPGWTRRHLLAHVGYNAAALRNLVTWASTGVETPMYPSAQARNSDIDAGALLPVEDLRNMHAHNASRLDTAWQSLSGDRWDAEVRTAQGQPVPASETVWMRAREVWIHTVDLGSGASFDDFPDEVLTDLFGDVLTAWQGRGAGERLTLHPTDSVLADTGPIAVDPTFDGRRDEVRGSTAALVGWLCGRSTAGVTAPDGITAPAWL